MKSGGNRGTKGGNKTSLKDSAKSTAAPPENDAPYRAFVQSLNEPGWAEDVIGGRLRRVKEVAQMAQVILAATLAFLDLLIENMPNLEKIREKAEDDAIKIGTSITVSYKDVAPKVTVKLSYSEVFSDSREVVLRDPNQIEMNMPDGADTEQEESGE